MEIITKNYNGIEINFSTNSETELYLNATQIAKSFGKESKHWLENKSTKEYIEAISRSRNSDFGDLVVVRKGGNNKNGQGTWIHKKLIIAFARWLSPDFAVWCDSMIEEILETGSYSIQAETEIDKNLKGLNFVFQNLKVNEASKILMTETLYKKIGLETSYLPKYSDENHTSSLSELLKKYEIGVSSQKINKLLISNGILEIKTRKSSKTEMNEKGEKKQIIKTFKSLTEKGLEFGKNMISPQNQRETQPHYFENKFKELLESVKIQQLLL